MNLEMKTITLNGNRIRYLTGGKGRPMLFLHGWPANPSTYREALERLSENFTVYAPYMFDLDCGNVRETAAYMELFLKKIKAEDVIIAGVSFGGMIGSLLSQKPGQASQLLLIGTAGVPRSASFGKMLMGTLKSTMLLTLKGHIACVFDRYLSIAAFLISLRKPKKRELFAEIRRSTKTHACHAFCKIKVPTTIIWCRDDDVFPAQNAAGLQKLISKSRLIMVDGDHYWPFNEPGQFCEAVISALN